MVTIHWTDGYRSNMSHNRSIAVRSYVYQRPDIAVHLRVGQQHRNYYKMCASLIIECRRHVVGKQALPGAVFNG